MYFLKSFVMDFLYSFSSLIKNQKQYLPLIFVYTFSFLFILINPGIFWDDWILYNIDSIDVTEMFKQSGSIWGSIFHNSLLSTSAPIIFYRLISFFSFLLSAIFLDKILKTIKEIYNVDRLYVVILFAIFPVNAARIALIDVPYALFHLLFFLAFYLLKKYLFNNKIIFRISSLILFFLSFATQSLLFFYLIVLAYLFYTQKFRFVNISKFVINNLDFIILPILFKVIKQTFFHPYGLYEGYNLLTLSKIISAISNTFSAFNISFWQVVTNTISINYLIITLFISIFVIKLFYPVIKLKKVGNNKYDLIMLLLGIIFLYLGTFPYYAVGAIASNQDWLSRHQLLVPLGASFLVYYGIKLILLSMKINKSLFHHFFYIFIISLFVITNMNTYFDYIKDWYKQEAIINNFKHNEIIQNYTTFLINDKTDFLNANQRKYRFYEYAGMFKYIYGEEKRFAVNKDEYLQTNNIDTYRPFFNSLSTLAEYKISYPQCEILIQEGVNKFTINNTIKLFMLDKFNRKEFDNYINSFINIEIKTL